MSRIATIIYSISEFFDMHVFVFSSHHSCLKFKSKVMDSIDELKRARLIDRKKSPEHRQMKILFITEDGKNVISFKNDIKRFLNSYKEFMKRKNYHYPYDSKILTDEMRSKLSNKNWRKNEMYSYVMFSQKAKKFAHESGILFLTVELSRYIRLLLKYRDNHLALGLITKIFEDDIYEHVGNNLTPLFSKNDASESEIMENILGDLNKNISHFNWYYSPNILGPNKAMGRDIKFLENDVDSVRENIYSLYRKD